MFWERNHTALATHTWHGPLLKRLALLTPEAAQAQVTLATTEAGDYTLGLAALPGQWLHNPNGAEAEARQLVAKHSQPGEATIHVLFGLGLGYLLEAVFEASSGPIFVLEPQRPLLRFVLDNVDLSRFFASGRVFLLDRLETLADWLPCVFSDGKRLETLATPAYARLMAEDIPRAMEILRQAARNFGNYSRLSLLYNIAWYQHFFENLPHWPEALPFAALMGRTPNLPAVIVSSGPSLEDSIEALRALQGRVLIFAVGGALRVLLQAGITPDFASFLDFDAHRPHLANLPADTSAIRFLLSPFADPAAFEVPCQQRFWLSFTTYPQFGQWMAQALLPPESPWAQQRICSGSSCSIQALYAAYAMGCSPMVLVGQDLAFRGTQKYAGDGGHVQFSEDGASYQVEDNGLHLPIAAHVREVRSQTGGLLKTSGDFLLILQQLEQFARSNADQPKPHQLINASTGGAWIEGFLHQPLSSLLDEKQQFPETLDKRALLHVSAESYPRTPEENRAQMLGQLQTFLEVAQEAQAQMVETRRVLQRFLTGFRQKRPPKQLQHTLQQFEGQRQALLALLGRERFLSSGLNRDIWVWKSYAQLYEDLDPETLASLSDAQLIDALVAENKALGQLENTLQDKLIVWAQAAKTRLETAAFVLPYPQDGHQVCTG